MAIAVHHAEQPILAGDGEQIARLAFDGCGEERTHLAQVAVVGIARTELPVPEQLAGLDVERHRRVGVQIGARARVWVKVRRRITDGDVEDPLLGIERQRRPQAAAAVFARLRIRPGFRARLAGIRNEIEAPDLLAGRQLERADPVLRTPIRTGRAVDDQILINRAAAC